MGVGLTCAVVDSRGALVALARMDNARYFTADVAVAKHAHRRHSARHLAR